MRRHTLLTFILSAALILGACQPATAQPTTVPTAEPTHTDDFPPPQVLRLATTTSTDDSGLLDDILPFFEAQYDAEVNVIAVGTGQAIELGTNGDVDVVLVHARAREDAFVEAGDGINRLDVMYNDFIIVGPKEDPAGIKGLENSVEAFTKLSDTQSPFASRGDDSGTNTKELGIWKKANIEPTPDTGWYFSLGQGMGETLNFANEKPAYTLTDRGTWLAQKDNLPNLDVMVGGNSIDENKDTGLLNPYGVIPVNPDKHAGVNFDLATKFADWITSVETQKLIGDFGKDKFGQPLFYPSSDAWKTANP